jgi:hypothetical protein
MRFDQITGRPLSAPRKKDHSQPKFRRQFYSGLLSAPSDKLFRNRSQQTRTVAAATVSIHTSAMREAS